MFCRRTLTDWEEYKDNNCILFWTHVWTGEFPPINFQDPIITAGEKTSTPRALMVTGGWSGGKLGVWQVLPPWGSSLSTTREVRPPWRTIQASTLPPNQWQCDGPYLDAQTTCHAPGTNPSENQCSQHPLRRVCFSCQSWGLEQLLMGLAWFFNSREDQVGFSDKPVTVHLVAKPATLRSSEKSRLTAISGAGTQ